MGQERCSCFQTNTMGNSPATKGARTQCKCRNLDFLCAAEQGDLAKTQLIQKKLSAHLVEDACQEAAITACAMGHWDVARFLVESIVANETRSKSYKDLAMSAARWASFDFYEYFVSRLDQAEEQRCRMRAFESAIKRRRVDDAEFLLNGIANGPEKDGWCMDTLDSLACSNHWRLAAPLLLGAISDQAAKNRWCSRAARVALECNRKEQVSLYANWISDAGMCREFFRDAVCSAVRRGLADTGIVLAAMCPCDPDGDLCRVEAAVTAAASGDLETVELFMSSITDSRIQEDCRLRVAAQAAMAGRANLVEAIGIKPDWLLYDAALQSFVATRAISNDNAILSRVLDRMQPDQLQRLLSLAISSGHVALALTLMLRIDRQHVNLPDSAGATALMLAADAGHHELINKLLELGASVLAEDSRGRTALTRACEAGHVRAVKSLLDGGADASHLDRRGLSCSDLAEKHGHCEVLYLLLPVETPQPSHMCSGSVEDNKTLDEYLSTALHSLLCEAGFTAHRARCQQELADLVQGLAQELGKPENWQMTGSYSEGWANSLVQVNGRTAGDSDIDWTVMVTGGIFHLQGGCSAQQDCHGASMLPVKQGHAQVLVGTGNQPAIRSPASGVRPSQDTCHAYQCCSGFTDGGVQLLNSLENQRVHLVSATRPQVDKELRVSFSFQEKAILRDLNNVQGQLFTVIKFIFKILLPIKLNTPGLKTYHAKTLLFFMLEKHGTLNEAAWKPENLISLLKESLNLMLYFLNSNGSPDECMPHFFISDAPLYFKNAGIGGEFGNTKAKVQLRLSELRADIETVFDHISKHLQPLQSENFYCHPFTLLPLKPPPPFTSQIRERSWGLRTHLLDGLSAVCKCLGDLQSAACDQYTLMRQVNLLQQLQWCRCAALCLTVMTHLKFGEDAQAESVATDLLSCFTSFGWQMDKHWERGRVTYLKSWRCPLDSDWAWRFCLPCTTRPNFPFLPGFTQALFTARLSQPHCAHLYVNFRCLSWSLQAELLKNCHQAGVAVDFDRWLAELRDDPDLEELLTLAHYSDQSKHLEFCLAQMNIIKEARLTMDTQDEEKIRWVQQKTLKLRNAK